MQTAVGINPKKLTQSDIKKALDYVESNFSEIKELKRLYFDKTLRTAEDRDLPDPVLERSLAQDFYRNRYIQNSNPAIKLTALMYTFDIPSIECLLD